MTEQTKSEMLSRPPIVAVLGHVDHGKTTLLDTIRKTNVTAREAGGITQHIGAYQVTVTPNGERPSRASEVSREISKGSLEKTRDDRAQNRTITFIDTPGHEAFAAMRSRGATAADIAILVVAADDSVKPQTKESIEQIKKAQIPFIVAANKMDLPTANIDRLKQDLAKVGVQVEGFGGDVPLVPISAKAGTGIDALLSMILLVFDMRGIETNPGVSCQMHVIETRLDKGKGMVATVIVKEGLLRVGTTLYEGETVVGKVRALFDEYGKGVSEAGPSKPVEILGFTKLPTVGSVLGVAQTASTIPTPKSAPIAGIMTPDFLKPLAEQEQQKLPVLLKADTAGSLEAITAALDTRIRVVASGVGDITEADILQAKATGSFVVGFHVKVTSGVGKLAQTEKVIYRIYMIIYELLDELSEVAAGMKEVITKERELGQGQIIAEFPYEKQRIAGTRIVSGRLAKGDTVKILRSEVEISRAKIKSIRRGKDEATKVETGTECGILFDKKVDFVINDAIIAVTTI